jgi:hypothetical protein
LVGWEILATGTGASEGAGLFKIRDLEHGVNIFTISRDDKIHIGPPCNTCDLSRQQSIALSTFSVNGDADFKGDVIADYLGVVNTLSAGHLTADNDFFDIGDATVRGSLLVVQKVTAQNGFNGKCNEAAPVVALGGGIAKVDCNQDVAEAFASAEPTEPGDLVVLLPQAAAEPTVRKARGPYEGLLVGVVSANPGLVFDHGQTYLAGDNAHLITQAKTVVALVGRARVKVDLENGSIAPGDPLTSSSTPGVSMKATKAGKIIGYALEGAEQAGEVLVLLQPSYYIPPLVMEQLNHLAGQ